MVVDFISFFFGVIVILLLAPAAVLVLECRTRNVGNAFAVREFNDKIDPFYMPVRLPWRRIEKLICIRKGLVYQ